MTHCAMHVAPSNAGLLLSGARVAGCSYVARIDWQKRQALRACEGARARSRNPAR
jgi:hypothetical protein